ncbi:HGxxPAAW family protein [Quadrisphaera sp. DSM 44207]|uniref:HGxxPAAW family protein n=1 Tax=Quadrisphaera sp. DSM 44207 TaxID=1881057 RepID=UPI000883AD34|nr:HGxxPAAW family protein [Quadrisphaera sp. DSM 44207]SDQ45413.1 hypothetical protein SAMN05428996_1765 [Quadrisphaera sp. DSM 44207]
MSHPTPTSGRASADRRQQPEAHTESHGHSVAAWTGVAIVIVGSLIGGIGIILAVVWLAAIGIALMPIGGIVGHLMGRRSKSSSGYASSDPDAGRAGG